LDGTTKAVCAGTLAGAVDGTSTTTSVTTTVTGTDYLRFNVPITAGSEKLATPNPTACSGAAANINTKSLAVVGLIVATVAGFLGA
jgi:hypothetical protein